jgi:diguanylate cyclase (GGDEF)-like protein
VPSLGATLAGLPRGTTSPLTFGTGPAAALAATNHTFSAAAPHRPAPSTSDPSSPATVIERFISSIPTWVWIMLGAALAAAAVATGAALRSGRRARRRLSEVQAATSVAQTDALTGLLNRRGFTEAVDQELERARRYGHHLALAFIDVRGLKAVNDSQGHLAGDRLLQDVGQLLSDSARTYDVVGRIGGDELAILLPEQSSDGVAAMAERIRTSVPRHRAALGLDSKWDLTIGTSVFPEDGDDFEQLLSAADRRLYEQRGIYIR